MASYPETLFHLPIFHSISREDISSLLHCITDLTREYKKSETVFQEGQSIKQIGVLLSGSLQILQDDYFGNRTILRTILQGEIFGESFALSDKPSEVLRVIASQDSKIIFLNKDQILKPCSKQCHFHETLIRNLLEITSHKNIVLTEKIHILSKRSTREKVLSYLSYEYKKKKTNPFVIPYDRQELADYLCVDRSALSQELSKLHKDGLIAYRKNVFSFLNDQSENTH